MQPIEAFQADLGLDFISYTEEFWFVDNWQIV